MPVASVSGKTCTFTFGALDASAQVTSISPARTASTETVQTLGGSASSANTKEITVALELLFDPNESGISALLHAAWVGGTKGTAEIDYGGTVATYAEILITDLGEQIPADGLVTQSATFASAEPDVITWAVTP